MKKCYKALRQSVRSSSTSQHVFVSSLKLELQRENGLAYFLYTVLLYCHCYTVVQIEGFRAQSLCYKDEKKGQAE